MYKKMADTIRFLAADMVQKANSGHPGAPMGLADILTVLSFKLKFNPNNPEWLNRDRVVFSGGHGSALIYSWLYLTGYGLEMEDLKNFRQLNSKTPGHPEYKHPIGVEITTGPLGQGSANGVGFGLAGKYAQNLLNRDNASVIDHKVYCFVGDGDLQEGISYEASSIAGKNALDNLVFIYDANDITIEGDLSLSFNEDVQKRFEAQGWEVTLIDGHNYEQIEEALNMADSQTKPLLIIAKTKIGKGSIKHEGSHSAHGAPLGEDDIKESKKALGFDPEKSFFVDEDVLFKFRSLKERGELLEKEWRAKLNELPYKEQNELLELLLNPDFSKIEYPSFSVGDSVATRDSSGKILNAVAKALPNFIGGSADLAPSNKTELKGFGDFPNGKNIRFGIREHAMAAITNAISLYGLFTPFCATFFVFSDYMAPSCRVSALMKNQIFYIWTHDSIGVGEDGATHQPVEQLSHFRALPNFYTFRPADGEENVECFKAALNLSRPCGFVLSRQKLEVFNKSASYGEINRGAYIIEKCENPQITLLATGSEVSLALSAKDALKERGVEAEVVSVPCFDLFNESGSEYQKEIIRGKKALAIEAARGLEWYKFADEVICMDSFGNSAPAGELFEYYGFSVENVIKKAEGLLG